MHTGRGVVVRLLSRLACLLSGHRFLPGIRREDSIRCWCTRCDQVVRGDLGVR